MLVSSIFPATAPVPPAGARDPTGRPVRLQGPPAVAPAAPPQAASDTSGNGAIAQITAGRATLMASLRARLVLPMADRALAGPPPSFQTSLIEELRREMQVLPLDRSPGDPGNPGHADRNVPGPGQGDAASMTGRSRGLDKPDRAATVPADGPEAPENGAQIAPQPHARVDRHL